MGIKYGQKLGERLANFNNSAYNPPINNASKGQCVWYTQGRSFEKCGVYIGARGNANDVYESCKRDNFQTSITPKPNSIACFKFGMYGHVKFVEYIIGDWVYYTEANSNADNVVSYDDGILKKMSYTNWMKQPNLQGHIVVKKEKLLKFKITTTNKKLGLYKSSNIKKSNRVKLIKPTDGIVEVIAGSGKKKNGRDIVKVLYKNHYYWAIRTTKSKRRHLKRKTK